MDIINKINNFLLKQKIYLKPGEKPPEGKQIEVGPRRGRYYEEGKRLMGQPKRRRLFPTSELQKKNVVKFEYKGRSIIHFPGKSNLYAIPKDILKGLGLEPSKDDLNEYKEIWKLTKGPLKYIHIDDFIILSNKKLNEVSQHLVWLVKNQKAVLNVDRWGNATFFKFV